MPQRILALTVFLLVLVVGGILVASAQDHGPAPITNLQVGRFELFNGTFRPLNDGNPGDVEHAVFKIDTATGRVWLYTKDGNTFGTAVN